jgi:chromosome segregation protein
MTLKRIELHGFKSFAKKSTLVFEAPVTAVVGPNGSGKSNVVEAIRFVLGEQSSKSLRSKSGADLIFKGSRMIPKMNRASVTIVFDNTRRLFQLPSLAGILSLDFDEISITREVFTDGINNYAINGSTVRLKDIHELISSVHIGSSGHHIISQGEADRLLNAKPAERREILEEALGLRLYHYRITESVKKLEKTREHMREVELLRRELAPQVKFLKKQVERVEQAQTMRNELATLYEQYLIDEESYITYHHNSLSLEITNLESKKTQLSDVLLHLEKNPYEEQLQHLQQRLSELHNRKRILDTTESELTRSIGRIEGTVGALSRVVIGSGVTTPIDQSLAQEYIEQLYQDINHALEKTTISEIYTILEYIKKCTDDFIKNNITSKTQQPTDHRDELTILQTELSNLESKLEVTKKESSILQDEIISLELDITGVQNNLRASDQDRFVHETTLREYTHSLQMLYRDQESLTNRFELLEQEYHIARELIGDSITTLRGSGNYDVDMFNESQHVSTKSTIERLKVRLEDMGGGAGDIINEYNETVERDTYLANQLQDLEKSVADLEIITTDLKLALTTEFHKGIHTINSVFEKFFITMFGGGSAQLQVTDIISKKRKTDDELPEDFSDDDAPREQGIDIDINLPRKKVKDLEMLSGGERSLTSIALLFALSQVNPPPFLVLDETDAALDEANSKKYGDMIETLALETQLIVVTHNRETMSRAGILYGVTLGVDDASTLLSIKFEEAVKVAK